ncbi:LysR family transcriptional regulator [Anaerolineales bacterium]
MLSLYKLEIFNKIVEEGSFSGAADLLFMSQSAVSQHIKILEASLGTTLFDRGRRGVTLTTAGHILHEYTLQILGLVAEAEAKVTRVENLAQGLIQIGATPGVNSYILPAWIQKFQTHYPNLQAMLQTGITEHIVAGVFNRQLDLGFIEGEVNEANYPHLGVRVISPIQLCLIVAPDHPWANETEIEIKALDQQPFVNRQRNSATSIWIRQTLLKYGVQPRIVGEFDSQESIKNAVAGGMGISILPDYAIKKEQQLGILHTLKIRDLELTRYLKIIWDTRHFCTPITRTFIHLLSQEYPSVLDILT